MDVDAKLRELAALNDTIRALTSTLDLPAVLRIVLDRIKVFTSAEALSLMLHDAERGELVFAATESLGDNVLVAVDPAVPRVVGPVLDDDRLVVPLCRAECVIGTLEIAGAHGRPFTADDQRRATVVAAEVAGLLVVDDAPPDEATLRAAFARVAAAVPSRTVTLVLHDAHGRSLAFRSCRTLRPGTIDGLRLRLDQGIAGWVARHREAVRLDDASADPRHYRRVASDTGLVPKTMLCVPVVQGDVLYGVIQVINKLDGSAFTEDELRLVQTLADHAAIAIANATFYRQAEMAALTDDLTGLSNTRHFNRVLPALLARGGPVSLLVLDLDGLKAVVDRHGHLVGSRTIAAVGGVIARHLRAGDVAARFGGDEFVVILPATDTSAARAVAESIRTTIAACPLPDLGVPAVTASLGVATFPDHAADTEALFRAADGAMYAVKRTTKNAVGVAGAHQ